MAAAKPRRKPAAKPRRKPAAKPKPQKWFRPLDAAAIETATAKIRGWNGAPQGAAHFIVRASTHAASNPTAYRETAVALAVLLCVARDANDMQIPGVTGTGSAEFQKADRAAYRAAQRHLRDR